nr:hypothetical protein [Duganella flavida]
MHEKDFAYQREDGGAAHAQGKIGTLADRPVYIAISRGGLRAILPTIGLKDLRFVD